MRSAPAIGAQTILLAITSILVLSPGNVMAQGGAPPEPAQVRESSDEKIILRVKKGEEIEVEELLKDMGVRLGQLVIPDKQLRGVKIKFLNNFDVTWDMLRFVLEMNDVKIIERQVESGETVMVAQLQRNLPSMLSQTPRFVPTEEVEAKGIPDTQEIITAIIQVQNGAGNDIFSALRGLVTRDRDRIGNILYIRGPEVIIIVDVAPKVRYYYQVIRSLDLPAPGQNIRVKQIVYAGADDIANTVNAVLRGGTSKATQPGIAAGQAQPQVISDPRTNQLLIQAFSHEFTDIEELIASLDIKVSPPPSNYFVHQVENSDAEELADKLNELFTGTRSQRQTTSTNQTNANQPGRSRPPVRTQTPRPTGNLGLPGGLNPALGELQTRIVAHEPTNSLLIQAEAEVYESIIRVLEDLDRKRKRVHIEAQVWEVSVPTDDLFIAVELAALDNASEGSVRGAAGTSFGISQLTFDLDQQRLSKLPNISTGLVGAVTKDAIDKLPLIISALHTTNRSRLLTQTFAVTNDNETATFTVSDRFPFLVNTVNNVASVQSVQFAEAATSLTIEPQVSSQDQLTLNLTLDIQSFTGGAVGGLPPPSNSRRYEGTVTIPNMRYVVFGGLERETESEVESKIPFLGDIPLLGYLFKSHQKSKTRTKIYIFVRPVILSDESFRDEIRTSRTLQQRVKASAGIDKPVDPILSDQQLLDPYGTMQDRMYELFGISSQSPFPRNGTSRD